MILLNTNFPYLWDANVKQEYSMHAQPRKGCFEVRSADGTKTYVSLLVRALLLQPVQRKSTCNIVPVSTTVLLCKLATLCQCMHVCRPCALPGIGCESFPLQLPLCSGQRVLCQKQLLQSIDSKSIILLQSMPRPFTKLKELDMDELAKGITSSA